MPTVYQVMADFNRRLAMLEGDASLLMAQKWKELEESLAGYILQLVEQINREGLKTSSEIFRLYRFRELLQIVQTAITQYEGWATGVASGMQSEAIDLGIVAALEAMGKPVLPFGINKAALQNMIGVCADGAPLFTILSERSLIPTAVEGLVRALIEGVAFGFNPRKTARKMADGMAGGLDKALTIARTEQLRVYREAERQQLLKDGVKQYQRHCAKSDRTCIACIAVDGEIYSTEELFASHPNCRCFMTVYDPTYSHGYPDAKQWFEGLDEGRQREILGKGLFELYREGVPLKEMARIKNDPVWGPVLETKPIKQIMAAYQNKSEDIILKPKPMQAADIDFSSITPQYLCDFMDMTGSYEGDPGGKYATSLPVMYVDLTARHLNEDETHRKRLVWLEKNKQDLIKAIIAPEIIEKTLRARNDGHYSATHFIKVMHPLDSGSEYMAVAISLANERESAFHQITTIYPRAKRAIFKPDGSVREKYFKLK